MMRKHKHVESAEFRRVLATSYIQVTLPKVPEPIRLWDGTIDLCAKNLSEVELEEVILFLSREKEVLSKQRNFPPVHEQMLSDLIKVQTERYGLHAEKKVKRTLGYGVSIGKLEEILGLYSNIKNVRISGVYLGSDMHKLDRGGLDPTDRELFVRFREVGEEDE